MIEDQTQYNRLYWSCRRGMRELDLLLIPFLKERYAALDNSEKAAFSALLECTDTDLYGWLTGKVPLENVPHATLIKKIHDYAQSTNHLKKIDMVD